MRDEVYIGNLVSPNELKHSAKGSQWKDHKYIKKEDGRYYYKSSLKTSAKGAVKADNRTPEQKAHDEEWAYWYPNGPGTGIKDWLQNGATDEELEAAEEEYRKAEEAYRENPTPNRRNRLELASEEVSRARSIKSRNGKLKDTNTKEELKKEAKRKAKDFITKRR